MRHQGQLSQQVASDATARLHALLVGAPCWYVSAGRGTWPSIHLALGDRILRDRPLRNDHHPEAFRTHDGSRSLVAWSDWVLKHGAIEVVTSAHPVETSERVDRLLGKSVSRVTLDRDRTLRVTFDDAWELVIRPASSPEDDEDTSWTLHVVAAQPGEPPSETVLQLENDGLVECASR